MTETSETTTETNRNTTHDPVRGGLTVAIGAMAFIVLRNSISAIPAGSQEAAALLVFLVLTLGIYEMVMSATAMNHFGEIRETFTGGSE